MANAYATIAATSYVPAATWWMGCSTPRWHGTRSVEALLEPAIVCCEEALPVRPHVIGFWHCLPRAGQAGNNGIVTRFPAAGKDLRQIQRTHL
jgi:hypothetical protein